MNKILKYTILIMGIGFIFAIFFMVLKDIQPPRLFILNLSFFVINAALLYLRVVRQKLHTAGNEGLSDSAIAGRRIMWISTFLYSCASLFTIIMSMLHRWDFRGALKVQITLVAILGLLYIHSRIVMHDMAKKQAKRNEAQLVINAMAERAKYAARIVRSRNYDNKYIDILEQISEYIAGLSIPRNRRARQLELQLSDKLVNLNDIVEADSFDADAFDREISATRNLISLRRDA
ncbi:MAG: hypothetical protein SNH01_02500 [Rikenellaceae bacterium]